MRVLTIRERELLRCGAGGALAAREEEALARIAPRLPRGTLVWERGGVRLGPFCGVVRAGGLTLEVLPKIEVGTPDEEQERGVLVAMLRSAGALAEADAGSAPLGLQRLHLLDVFILDFCARVTALLRRGAIRSYRAQEDDPPALRGRLRLAEQLRRAAVDQGRVHCRFDELTADNPHNRGLRAVLARLHAQALGPEAKAAADGLLRRLEGVSDAPCTAADVARLPFDRLTEAWRPVFKQAEAFLRGLFPDARAGGDEGICLLFDMQRLFEAFVGARLRRGWRGPSAGGSRVVLQGPPRYLADSADGPAFRLRPDAAVVSDDNTVERLVDAKWKRLEPGAAGRGVAREDAYQLAAYAGAYGCRRVALAYPRPAGLAAGLVEGFDLRLPGKPRIEVFAVDLASLAAGGALPAGLCPDRSS